MKLVRVAGGIVWRETSAGSRIAVVHRRRRDDWSLPKGKVDAGEGWQDAARREIAEETGSVVRLGRFAGAKLYVERREPKLVLYWHARVVHLRSPRPDGNEIDEVAWLSRREALDRLDHESDRRLLLRALGERVGEPGAPRRWPRLARPDPDELARLVIVDSARARARDELAAALRIISSALAARGGPAAKRA